MQTPDYRRISSSEEFRFDICQKKIKENLDLSVGELLDSLVAKGFNADDKDEILKETHRLKQIDLLLKRLKYRADGYRIFIKSLKESGHGYLADLLESDEICNYNSYSIILR